MIRRILIVAAIIIAAALAQLLTTISQPERQTDYFQRVAGQKP